MPPAKNTGTTKSALPRGRGTAAELSLATAFQFYDVQDRLGCDRPSKAIDWLIEEAEAAIDALEMGILLSLEFSPHNLEANWEMGRLQKMFTWNTVNESSSNESGGGEEYFFGNSN